MGGSHPDPLLYSFPSAALPHASRHKNVWSARAMPATMPATTMMPLAPAAAAASSFSSRLAIRRQRCGLLWWSSGRGRRLRSDCLTPSGRRRPSHLRVLDESKGTDVSLEPKSERSESDVLVDGMDFGELCNEFECVSSPYVEATARQLVRDILELREGNRALGSFAVSVKYEDPIRSFVGREKYKRPLWSTDALENPTVSVQEMAMLSTSLLSIKWTIKGKPKNFLFASIRGDLILRINSRFSLNQISGQVIEHEEIWDLSSSSIFAQGYFWISRSIYSAIQAGSDTVSSVKELSRRFPVEEDNTEIYPDPSGDPTKFFERGNDFQRDAYQIALFLAVVYFVVQFLKTTL